MHHHQGITSLHSDRPQAHSGPDLAGSLRVEDSGSASEPLATTGGPAAHMEYDPLGNLLPTSTGAFAEARAPMPKNYIPRPFPGIEYNGQHAKHGTPKDLVEPYPDFFDGGADTI